MTKARRLLL